MEIVSDKLVKAFLQNKIISPIPLKFVKNIAKAKKLRELCESKINIPIIGFKAGGTSIPVLKKLREKEPFYAAIFKNNFLQSNQKVKINSYTLGIELEVCFLIKREFFLKKEKINLSNINKIISHMAPCIEIVGYRQKKKGLKYLGDICSDFGANVKFLIGKKIKYKKLNFDNLKTKIYNTKSQQCEKGNTNTVYKNPLNSLKFILNKIKKNKINLRKSFYVFTGSTVGVVPIKKKGLFIGTIDNLGSVKALIV